MWLYLDYHVLVSPETSQVSERYVSYWSTGSRPEPMGPEHLLAEEAMPIKATVRIPTTCLVGKSSDTGMSTSVGCYSLLVVSICLDSGCFRGRQS